MHYELVGGTGDDKYNFKYNTVGNVFGGGEGIGANPETYPITPTTEHPDPNLTSTEFGNKHLVDIMGSVENTVVTITDTTFAEYGNVYRSPWVKGSVYGGAPMGHVFGNTRVRVKGGQIGAGNGTTDELYTDGLNGSPNQFINPAETPVTDENALHETQSWTYDPETHHPFDPVKIYKGMSGSNGNYTYSYVPTDGKTWFGNVYGGGSGYVPYIVQTTINEHVVDSAVWNPESGNVHGNTRVEISGGHILSSVYGGCETSDVGLYGIADAAYHAEHPEVPEGGQYCTVGGTSTVIMSGGTVGVPRTKGQILHNPDPGYVFGAGKGDLREKFDDFNLVNITQVTISDKAIVYGSVFGGAEEGHVLTNANVEVKKNEGSTKSPVIGSSGFSGYDGHVFGGGWGDRWGAVDFNFASGRVGGNTHVTMSDGTVLGNVYGGGFVARIGVGPDGHFDDFISGTAYDSIHHGMTQVDVSGGYIGNAVNGGLTLLTETEKSGNVYGGGRGSEFEYFEDDFGRVAKAVVQVTNNPTIYGSVFGGGQMANVGHWNTYATWYTTGTGLTSVTIEGTPKIGTNLEFTEPNYSSATNLVTQYDVINNARMLSHTRTGNVYGGGQGDMTTYTENNVVKVKGFEQGHCRTTRVDINMENGSTNDQIMGSVYGGSEQGAIWGDTKVTVAGGTIGKQGLTSILLDPTTGEPTGATGTYSYGNVFGGSYGMDSYSQLSTVVDPFWIDTVCSAAGRVYGNAFVNITGGAVRCNVFGGGHMASVGYRNKVKNNGNVVDIVPAAYPSGPLANKITGNTTVSVTGSAIIGPLDNTGLNAYVFGGGKGVGNDPSELRKLYANVNNAVVTVNMGADGHVWGSLFGGGSDGHVLGDASVTLNGGTIGTDGKSSWDGNIFGGGRNYQTTNLSAGRVRGNITVTMTNGTLKGSIFGGGRQALTGVNLSGARYEENTEDHGNITVNVSGGTIGIVGNYTAQQLKYIGHVFGGGKGTVNGSLTPFDYNRLGEVRSTKVTIGGDASLYGSAYGGSENGYVLENAIVTVNGTDETYPTIGTTATDLNGTVYGGGRGVDPSDNGGVYNPEAGLVMGQASANVNGGIINNHVFGGGDRGIVAGARIANINGGTINHNVYGGSNVIPAQVVPDPDPEHSGQTISVMYPRHGSLKTVNVRDGRIKGNVFGCSNNTPLEGDPSLAPTQEHPSWTTPSQATPYWTSFVNITGGTIDGSVFGSSYVGEVKGSVCTNIGYNAVLNPLTLTANAYRTNNGAGAAITPSDAHSLLIKGSVYGGTYYPSTGGTENRWNTYDVSGYSKTYIDGTGYNTTDNTDNYMDIQGGLFGCGTHCESGALGREVFLRKYGTRITTSGDEVTSATRTLLTAQRISNFVIDESNVNFTGYEDISGVSDNIFAVVKVSDTLYVANASSLVLGSVETPAYMDTIRNLRSCYLTSGDIYANAKVRYLPWGWIGINGNTPATYHMNGASPVGDALSYAQENVILFNGASTLWVRYVNASGTRLYGELNGFFRMRADAFTPIGNASFAYARQKLTVENGGISSGDPVNGSDGGFLSYNGDYNFYTIANAYGCTQNGNDGGTAYTFSKQYPYTNLMESSKDDMVDLRMWVINEVTGQRWYVDGRKKPAEGGNGIGVNDMTAGRGLYPDMPKLTISKAEGHDGIYAGAYPLSGSKITFNQETDAIYVVGAVSSAKELDANVLDGLINEDESKPLRLFRYPGGHPLSSSSATDPGPNYHAMVEVEAMTSGQSLTLNNVTVDGLYDYTNIDGFSYPIPNSFHPKDVEMPLVVTHANSVLNLIAGTTLTRGYNKTEANLWYENCDYKVPANVYHGGALFVDSLATVNVSGLVSIHELNYQKRTIGGNDRTVECNVYLPTFMKSLNITGTLHNDTKIGITSPKRAWNWATHDYTYNTFSPVAVVTAASDAANIANAAWMHCNFTDDQEWFFANQNKLELPGSPASPRTTYYNGTSGKDGELPTLYFGWTWASVSRTEPSDYSNTDINSPEDLAWLITRTQINQVPNENLKLTADLDMQHFVWVPIGEEGSDKQPFNDNFDGQGHLIKNLYIDYIGTGDARYELTHYGMFGYVNSGKIDRTFVVSGSYDPVVSVLNGDDSKNIGGLVGYMNENSMVSNSEAAVMIPTNNFRAITEDEVSVVVTGNNVGGLVGMMAAGEVHSSMAMNTLSAQPNFSGTLGGLVGNATGGQINNSFVNGTFYIHNSSNTVAGGLLGNNTNATMKNCYATWVNQSSTLTSSNFGSIAASNTTASKIEKCYVTDKTDKDDHAFEFALSGSVASDCYKFTDVMSADNLGYMYSDNIIHPLTTDAFISRDTAMFGRLNKWVDRTNGSTNHKYARWARPGLAYNETVGEETVLRTPINGDLPVLLLSDGSSIDITSTDDFRSLATLDKGKVLQYGGTARDGADKHLSTMLERDEYVFVYGDVCGRDVSDGKSFDGDDALAGVTIQADKVSIYEHASIMYPGKLAELNDTYVGISFDNSCGHAESTPGVNYGLNGLGIGSYELPRDYHMFSTPLSNAPMGFDYGDDNKSSGPRNNPWVNSGDEFNWLDSPNDWDAHGRYWMKTFADNADGYFPTTVDGTAVVQNDNLFVPNSDECPASTHYRYPYGMDFFAWNEPQYHWVNFKRNGPNHWHTDVNAADEHLHLEYVTETASNHTATSDINEEILITGKGYLASITLPTFMQSHGTLNGGSKYIGLKLTSTSKMAAWNLVGNPYHGYIDFNLFAAGNTDVLTENNQNQPFYVVYDADTYQDGRPGTGFLYRPADGSNGGEYAGRYIHPHQGFYVQAKKADNLNFTESMIVPRSSISINSDFREIDYPLVNLYLSSDNGCHDVTVIEFERPDWGGAEKIKELRVGNGLFYAHHGDDFYAALFAPKGIDRVPVWFEAKEDDIFTLKWNTANGDFQSMYLIDNITGIQYDMLRNDTYVFEGHKKDYWSRFYIVFNVTDVEENEIHNFVFFDGSEYVVTGEGDLEFIDVLGHVLMHTHVEGGQTRVRLPKVAPAIYMMRLTNGQECQVQKIFVK